MSEQKSTLTHEESRKILADVHGLLQHCNKHVYKLSVKTVQFDEACEWCQLELKRPVKRSDNPVPAALKGKPIARVSMITTLCSQRMHFDCMKDYVLTQELITIHCMCHCHDKVQTERTGRKRKR